MKSNNKKLKFTKEELKDVHELEKPDFIVSVNILTYSDLKKWHIIDSKTFKRHIKKKIKRDYEGGDTDD